MVDICHKFVSERNLSFGTNIDPKKSKTKCLVFSKKRVKLDELKPIKLDGHELPWVESIKHLGHILESNNSMKMDTAQKRGVFIGRTNSLLQEFNNIAPSVLLKLVNSTAMSFYGSNLWDLFCKDTERVYTAYNVAVRNILNVDRCTHRFLIEPLSDSLHLKTILASKFVTFHESLMTSSKLPVRFLAHLVADDLRTVHGRNLYGIATLCGMRQPIDFGQLRSRLVKNSVRYRTIPDSEEWRVNMCKELLNVRENDVTVPGFSSDELEELLGYLCSQ